MMLELKPIREEIEGRLKHLKAEIDGLLAQQEAIIGRIHELERQHAIWQEAWKLELPESERLGTLVPNADKRLLDMPLSEAVDHLRRQNLGMTKELALMHLQAVGYDFHGKRPSAAVHFAWVNSLRRGTHKNGRNKGATVPMGMFGTNSNAGH